MALGWLEARACCIEHALIVSSFPDTIAHGSHRANLTYSPKCEVFSEFGDMLLIQSVFLKICQTLLVVDLFALYKHGIEISVCSNA